METNPYVAPQSDVRAPRQDVPDAVHKKIRSGWITAIVSGVLTLLAVVAAVTMGAAGMFNAWNLLDVVLIFFLAFWIHKRSRVAATTMFFYFLVSKIIVIVETGSRRTGASTSTRRSARSSWCAPRSRRTHSPRRSSVPSAPAMAW